MSKNPKTSTGEDEDAARSVFHHQYHPSASLSADAHAPRDMPARAPPHRDRRPNNTWVRTGRFNFLSGDWIGEPFAVEPCFLALTDLVNTHAGYATLDRETRKDGAVRLTLNASIIICD